ncbi:MAG TPA: DinB family protein [Acidimicrobiales bacterium]
MNEFELLKQALGQQRAHVLAAVEGLDETQLTTSLVRSDWSPAELVSHLTFHDERFWFRDVFAGQDVARDDDPTDAWVVAPGDGHAIIARYRDECALADEVIAAHGARDEPHHWPEEFGSWRLSDLYEIMLHVVTETAQHAGHLDIVREMIDGTQYMVIDELMSTSDES